MWFLLSSLAFGGPAAPADVVSTLFEVAASGEVAKLATLCDPKGENDGDTKRLCALATDPAGLSEFQAAFKGGKLAGEPTIEGNKASVPFTFGPDYSGRAETMTLIRRDEGWFLFSF